MHPELVSIIAVEMMKNNPTITNTNNFTLIVLLLLLGGVTAMYGIMLSSYLYRQTHI